MIINSLYIINNDVDAHAPNPQGGTASKYLILVLIFHRFLSGFPSGGQGKTDQKTTQLSNKIDYFLKLK